MNQIQNLLFLTLFSLLAVSHAQAADYDIVIESGRVMDPESGFDAVANVGIRDGSIATVTRDAIDGDRVIDLDDGDGMDGYQACPRCFDWLWTTRKICTTKGGKGSRRK